MTLGNAKMDDNASVWPADWFEEVDCCLLCESADFGPGVTGVQDWFFQAVPGLFQLDRCSDCQSLVLRKRPKPTHLGEAYVGYYTHASSGMPTPSEIASPRLMQAYRRYRFEGSTSISDRLIAAVYACFPERSLRVNLRHRFLPRRPSRVLDFGCGSGDFLRLAKNLGHDVFGLDFDPDAVAAAQSQGVAASVLGDATPAELDSRFDHIVANHVLEHVADPVALLRDFNRWLAPGGTIFVEFPNGEAEGLRRYGRYWRGLEAPRHFSVPSAKGISLAARRAGFSRVEILGQPAEQGIRDAIWSQSEVARADDPSADRTEKFDGHEGETEFLSVLIRKD